MSRPPALSVVIAASDSAAAVERAVQSLACQEGAEQIEILVAAASDRVTRLGRFEGIELIVAPSGTSVPRLRRLGYERARAPVVVFTEDSCRFDPGWTRAWVEAFEASEARAATGPVEPAMGESPVDWAVFFCEYAAFLAHRSRESGRAGDPIRLAGNNFAVRRDWCRALERDTIHETVVNAELVATPGALFRAEGAVAWHVRRYRFVEALSDRWRFGLEYGRLRAERSGRLVRALALLAAPAILGVQAARLTAQILGVGRYRGRFLAWLPVTLTLLAAWSAGESLGWALGPVRSESSGSGRTDRRPAPPGRRGRWPRRCKVAPGRASEVGTP